MSSLDDSVGMSSLDDSVGMALLDDGVRWRHEFARRWCALAA
jgi:hypothetical protein